MVVQWQFWRNLVWNFNLPWTLLYSKCFQCNSGLSLTLHGDHESKVLIFSSEEFFAILLPNNNMFKPSLHPFIMGLHILLSLYAIILYLEPYTVICSYTLFATSIYASFNILTSLLHCGVALLCSLCFYMFSCSHCSAATCFYREWYPEYSCT